MIEFRDAWAAIQTGGIAALLLIIIIGGARQWWVFGWLYSDMKKSLEGQVAYWQAKADEFSQASERTIEVAEKLMSHVRGDKDARR